MHLYALLTDGMLPQGVVHEADNSIGAMGAFPILTYSLVLVEEVVYLCR